MSFPAGVVLLLIAVVPGLAQESLVPSAGYGTGDRLPDWELSLLREDGTAEKMKISQLGGEAVLLWFYAQWSPPCAQEAAALESRCWQTYRSRRLVVVGVALKDGEEEVRKFRGEHHLTFRLGQDRDGSLFNAFRQEGIPLHVLLGAERKILYVACGFEEETLRGKIREALGE